MQTTTRLRAALLVLALGAFSCKPGQPAASPPASSEPQSPELTRAQVPASTQSVNAVMAPAPSMSPAFARKLLEDAYQAGKETSGGKNADYIPVLAKVDSNLFAVAIALPNGEVVEIGDAKHSFSIQSIEKVFTLARIVEDLGAAAIASKVGVGATGMPFNSILAIELNDKHRAGNPFVNAGAMTSVSLVPAKTADERWQRLSTTLNEFAGRVLPVDQEVYKSETASNTGNRAISFLLKKYEVMQGDPQEALDLYTRLCSLSVTAHDLAVMGATLGAGGVNPVTKRRVVSPETAAKVLAVMGTAGLYENTGDWMYNVGVPAKSGVGGGIVAVVPGKLAIGTFAPPLDEAGNSVRSQKAIEVVVREAEGNVFAARSSP